MKKIKVQKGITLIALIITIIVLLILAVVTIGEIQDGKIITYAQNAANDYNEEKGKEESTISGYESLIEQYTIPGNEEVAPPKDKLEEIESVAYYISNDKSGMEIIQKLDNENLLCTTYFKETNGEYLKKADTQIEVGEAIVESITINAYNYSTETDYSETLQPGTKVYYINIDGEKIPALYVTDNEMYGLSDYGYAIFELVTDESLISDIEAGIVNAE